jgi:hypothetical protein
MTVYAFSQTILPKGARLDQDVVLNTPLVATTGVFTYDVEVSYSDWLVTEAMMTGSAIADLAVTVQPFEGDNVTLSAVVLTPQNNPPEVMSAGSIYHYARWDVIGLGRVRIFYANKNAAAQTLSMASWRTQGF